MVFCAAYSCSSVLFFLFLSSVCCFPGNLTSVVTGHRTEIGLWAFYRLFFLNLLTGGGHVWSKRLIKYKIT